MIHYIKLIDLVDHIESSAITKYLEDTGWKHFLWERKGVKIYQFHNSNGLFQADIPVERSLSDYGDAMIRALKIISKAENRPVEQIVVQLLALDTASGLALMGYANGDILFVSVPQ